MEHVGEEGGFTGKDRLCGAVAKSMVSTNFYKAPVSTSIKCGLCFVLKET